MDSLTETLNVAVLGPLGTYTHEAAHNRFGIDAIYHERRTITDTINTLSDAIPIAVVPQENSIFGSVIETYDNFRRSDCGFVQGEVLLKVTHCLVVKKGVTLGGIRRVMSHEQALGQCHDFLNNYLPGIEQVKMPSTAAAAHALLDSPPSYAAICSKLCASMFDDLDVIREGIQAGDVNYTRFLIMTTDRSSTIPAQFSVAICYKAIFRIPIHPSSSDLMRIFKLITAKTKIVRIDRRPDPRATTPFQDVYFVEITRLHSESSIDIVAWATEVDALVLTIKQAGDDVNLIGIW
ncbi:hypothetical protein AX14_005536 [Amanita brunnescens Koide BX004]|nr:hypothetical protein AX14_005536 [Amanita brunnescens Koide BX004]